MSVGTWPTGPVWDNVKGEQEESPLARALGVTYSPLPLISRRSRVSSVPLIPALCLSGRNCVCPGTWDSQAASAHLSNLVKVEDPGWVASDAAMALAGEGAAQEGQCAPVGQLRAQSHFTSYFSYPGFLGRRAQLVGQGGRHFSKFENGQRVSFRGCWRSESLKALSWRLKVQASPGAELSHRAAPRPEVGLVLSRAWAKEGLSLVTHLL